MPVVNHVLAHPIGESHVVTDEFQIVTAFSKPCRLCCCFRVEEANGEVIQTLRRRRRPNLAGRNWITAQQKVLPCALSLKGTEHRSFNHLMSPFQAPFRRASQHAQLGDFDNVRKLWCDHFANGGLAHSAGTGDEEKHRSGEQFCVELPRWILFCLVERIRGNFLAPIDEILRSRTNSRGKRPRRLIGMFDTSVRAKQTNSVGNQQMLRP